MGLFHRNSNEQNFAGGSKNIMESLQNDFQGDGILVKRDEREDFNTGSVITVYPGDEAVFIKNGEIIGVLGNGRHELHTENYPFLSRLRNMVTGGISTFTARVYYVRTAHSIIDWGTPNGIEYHDRWFKCPTTARGYGQYWITFRDIPTFITNLMGNEYSYTRAQLSDAFNGVISSQITRKIAKILGELTETREILALNDMQEELEELLRPHIQEVLDEYGLELKRYYIETLSIDEDERRAEAVSMGSAALANARAIEMNARGRMAELNVLGDQYNRVKGMDLLQTLAENPGSGGMASAGAGLGMGMAAAGAFSGLAQSVFSDAAAPRNAAPHGSFSGSGRFDNNSNNNSAAAQPDPTESLMKMKQLLDAGLISKEQYDAKVAEILSRM